MKTPISYYGGKQKLVSKILPLVFENLLKALQEIKGKFILSSYPSTVLQKYVKANGWHYKCFEQGISVNSKSGYIKKKWEMITTNYPI